MYGWFWEFILLRLEVWVFEFFNCFNLVSIICFWWNENVGWWVYIVINNDSLLKNFFLLSVNGWKLFKILNNMVVVCLLFEWSSVRLIYNFFWMWVLFKLNK